jgi:hypothetical protein
MICIGINKLSQYQELFINKKFSDRARKRLDYAQSTGTNIARFTG